jgi:hypothetical protein
MPKALLESSDVSWPVGKEGGMLLPKPLNKKTKITHCRSLPDVIKVVKEAWNGEKKLLSLDSPFTLEMGWFLKKANVWILLRLSRAKKACDALGSADRKLLGAALESDQGRKVLAETILSVAREETAKLAGTEKRRLRR